MLGKVLLGGLIAIALTSAARAQSLEAETLFQEGEQLMSAGNLAEACTDFEASNRIEPRAGTLIRLGECREQNHQLASAWSAYTDALTRVKDPRKRQIATRAAAALKPRLSQLTIMVPNEVRVAGLVITRDGKALDEALWNRPIPIDGGTYVISGKAPGHEEWTTSVLVPIEGGLVTMNVPQLKELVTPAPTVTAPVANMVNSGGLITPRDRAPTLFTMSTYPVSELLRPLTMAKNITQVRLSLGTDISARGALESFGLSLEGLHGLSHNFTVIGGLTDAFNFKQFSLYFGFERALAYDLVDIRLAANLHRLAIPYLVTMTYPDGLMTTEPNGNYLAGATKLSVDIGFPFRYSIKPEIAIIALQTLMSIDFNSITGNKATPDLNPSVGVATNPIPALSLVVFAQLQIVDFNTDAGNFRVPVTGRVEFSPNQKFDIGLEFVLLNVKPPEPQKFYDNRFVSLFLQSRFGK